MKNYISINILYIRKVNYLERKELAEKYGLTPAAIGSYELNKSNPNINFIQKFCKEFNISIDDFINKDLSKLKKDNHYVEEVKEPYHLIDKKTETMMQNIIDSQTQTIESKQQTINEKEKLIVVLEKIIERLEAIINQNGLNN